MAGIQQAVNALTGAIGTVGGRIGVYNELVGKNKELIEKLVSKNEELEKKNKELDDKNKIINIQDIVMKGYNEKNMSQYQQIDALRSRLYANTRARASRDKMLDIVYGEKPATTAVPNVKSNEGGR